MTASTPLDDPEVATAPPSHVEVPAVESVTPEGSITLEAAEPLVCFRDLRVSMFAMTLGMAYMFAAMQLAL